MPWYVQELAIQCQSKDLSVHQSKPLHITPVLFKVDEVILEHLGLPLDDYLEIIVNLISFADKKVETAFHSSLGHLKKGGKIIYKKSHLIHSVAL